MSVTQPPSERPTTSFGPVEQTTSPTRAARLHCPGLRLHVRDDLGALPSSSSWNSLDGTSLLAAPITRAARSQLSEEVIRMEKRSRGGAMDFEGSSDLSL
jgi:hypothetical protein